MRSSDFLIEKFLPEVEGVKDQPYLDTGKKWTVGVGHLMSFVEIRNQCVFINGKIHKFPLSKDEIFLLLLSDLIPKESAVNFYVNVSLSQFQFDCLTSFVFNLGKTNFVSSTLLKRINAGRFDDVPNQLRRWVYDDGKQIPGLITRRSKEVKLWLGEYNRISSVVNSLPPIPQAKPVVNLL